MCKYGPRFFGDMVQHELQVTSYELQVTSYELRVKSLTLFRMGWPKRSPPTSFSPATSTNIGISPQNFLIFSFNPFAILL